MRFCSFEKSLSFPILTHTANNKYRNNNSSGILAIKLTVIAFRLKEKFMGVLCTIHIEFSKTRKNVGNNP